MVKQRSKDKHKEAKCLQNINNNPRIFHIFVLLVIVSQSKSDSDSEQPDDDSSANIG